MPIAFLLIGKRADSAFTQSRVSRFLISDVIAVIYLKLGNFTRTWQ